MCDISNTDFTNLHELAAQWGRAGAVRNRTNGDASRGRRWRSVNGLARCENGRFAQNFSKIKIENYSALRVQSSKFKVKSIAPVHSSLFTFHSSL